MSSSSCASLSAFDTKMSLSGDTLLIDSIPTNESACLLSTPHHNHHDDNDNKNDFIYAPDLGCVGHRLAHVGDEQNTNESSHHHHHNNNKQSHNMFEAMNKTNLVRQQTFDFVRRASPKCILAQPQQMSQMADQDNRFRCPLCLVKRDKFFCSICIRNGDFTHSKINFFERFADKKLKFIKLKSEQTQMSNEVEKRCRNSILKEDLNMKICEIEKNITILNRVILEKSASVKEQFALLNEVKRNSLKSKHKQMNINRRIEDIRNLIAKQKMTIAGNHRLRSQIERQIQHSIREQLCTLTSYIFPIGEEFGTSRHFDAFDDEDHFAFDDNHHHHPRHKSETFCASLDRSDDAEAMPLLSFDCDSLLVDRDDDDDRHRHARDDRRKNKSGKTGATNAVNVPLTRYRILNTWLSSKENYRNLTSFNAGHHIENLDIRDNRIAAQRNNDNYRITSALSYMCQLINLIAKYCDVHLPKKLLYCEFYFNKDFKRDEYLWKIGKLNGNILFLCAYNRVDVQSLHPIDAFRNVEALLNSPTYIGNLDNFMEMSNPFYKKICDNLLHEFASGLDKVAAEMGTGGIVALPRNCAISGVEPPPPAAVDCDESHDDEDYDFVENNIPDLNFFSSSPSSPNTSSSLSSIPSSFTFPNISSHQQHNAQSSAAAAMPNILSFVSSFYRRTTGHK